MPYGAAGCGMLCEVVDDGRQVERAMRELQAAVDAALLGPARAAIDQMIAEVNAAGGDLVLSVDDVDLRLRLAISWDDRRGGAGDTP